MPDPIDFNESNIDALPWQWRDEDRLSKLVEVLSSQTLAIQEDVLLLFDIDNVDIADGVLLDLIGSQVGRTRVIDEGDIDYRRGLVVQILTNHNTGLANEIGNILDFVLNRPETEQVIPYDRRIAEMGVIMRNVQEVRDVGYDKGLERYTAAGIGVCIQLGSVHGMFRLGGFFNGVPTTPSPGKPLNTLADQTRGRFGSRCYKRGPNQDLVPFALNGPGPLHGRGLSSLADKAGGQFITGSQLFGQPTSPVPYYELSYPILAEDGTPIFAEFDGSELNTE